MFPYLFATSFIIPTVSFLFVVCASAATIDRYADRSMGCDLLLSGSLESGDAEALRLALLRSDLEIAREIGSLNINEPMIGFRPRHRSRICFNSPGGSFLEGLRIAEILIEYRKGAAVGADMICESACAIAFMGGSMASAGVEGSDDTDRVLHPNARLGFHAPSLIVPDGQYTEASVSHAYEIALASLQALSRTRTTVFRGYVPRTDQVTSFRYDFPESLLLELLGTAPYDMRYVRTVGEASRWDIRIGPVRFPETTSPYARFAAACDNILSYWSEFSAFNLETPPFRDAQNGRLISFEVQPASDLSSFGGFGQANPWRGAGRDGVRLIADIGEYWVECDVEIFAAQATFDAFSPVGGVNMDARRQFYPFQLFDPTTEIAALAQQPGQVFDGNSLIASLSAEVTATLVASAVPCWLTSPTARITNVNEFVNLRRQPDFSAPVVRQIPVAERVRATRADNITIIGQERDRRSCINACEACGRNADDRVARDRAQQCIQDNMIWHEVTDARGNRGWVSRRYLEEVE